MPGQVDATRLGLDSRVLTRSSFKVSPPSVPRLFVSVLSLLFLVISSILLLRRSSGAFEDSLAIGNYALFLFLAGAFCVGLKCVVELTSLRLSAAANGMFTGLIGLALVLFSSAIFPDPWTWSVALSTAGWLAIVVWFCVSRRSVANCQITFQSYVLPVVAEFFYQPSMTDTDRDRLGIVSPPSSTSIDSAITSTSDTSTTELAPENDPQPVRVSDTIAPEPVLKFADYTSPGIESDAEEADAMSTCVRRIESNGDDVFEAHVAARFAFGMRQTVLHIPFTPPFATQPDVECEIADGSDVRLKVGAIFPYGVRLELKRSGPDLEELSVAVDVFAVQAVSRSAT